MICPVAVRYWVTATWPIAFAIPKSATFASPSAVTSTFSGLRSRWTIPCVAASASAAEHALEHAGHLRERQPPDERPQRAALEVLHGDERHALVLEVLDHRDDARVVEPARHARLVQEAVRERGVGDVDRVQLLERDLAPERLLPREMHRRHAASAQQPLDLVATDRARRHASLDARGPDFFPG